MKFDKTQKRALVFVAGLLGLSWYMGNQFEKADMMRSEADAYTYAYNEGHSDSRKDEGYQPTLASAREEGRFRKILKQRAETFDADSGHFRKVGWVIPKEAYPRYMRVADNNWAKDFYCDEAWVERHGDEYTLNWVVRAYKPTKVQRPAESVFSKTYPYTEKGWFNGYMRWAQIPMRGKNWSAEVQEKLGAFISKRAETFNAPYAGSGSLMNIGQDTSLGNFTSKELTQSSAIHGDFNEASLNYSGHQNLQVRGAESFNAESYQINDEGMFEGGEVRIVAIEDHSHLGRAKVYIYTRLDESGNSDGFIHTANQRRFENQFSLFPREMNAETFENLNETKMKDLFMRLANNEMANFGEVSFYDGDNVLKINNYQELRNGLNSGKINRNMIFNYLDNEMSLSQMGAGNPILDYIDGYEAETVRCDNCAEDLGEEDAQFGDVHVVTSMPVDFDSGEAGESATLCGECYDDLVLNAETMTPSEVKVKVTKDVTPKGSKVIVEECVDIQAHKADATANFYRVRFRDPAEMSNFRVPAWAARAANTMGSKYYDVAGSKVTMGQDKTGNWKIQSVMVPKRANVDVALALKIANHIQDRLEKEGQWASKKCQDNERVLIIR